MASAELTHSEPGPRWSPWPLVLVLAALALAMAGYAVWRWEGPPAELQELRVAGGILPGTSSWRFHGPYEGDAAQFLGRGCSATADLLPEGRLRLTFDERADPPSISVSVDPPHARWWAWSGGATIAFHDPTRPRFDREATVGGSGASFIFRLVDWPFEDPWTAFVMPEILVETQAFRARIVKGFPARLMEHFERCARPSVRPAAKPEASSR